jgi:hypothetical protein
MVWVRTRLATARVLRALAIVGLAACAPPVNIAGDTLQGPRTGDAFEGVQCSAVRPQTEPDLMAWDPGSRANLNRLRGAGVVAVRYEAKGCNVELELLSNCIGVANKYQFSPYSANEHKVAHNASELFAQLPIGAAALGADVKGGRALRTDYMLAGQYSLPPDATFRASDLRGLDCRRATHVISAIYVGAFVMGAGESRELDTKATLFGAGMHSDNNASVDVLNTEGDADACFAAQKDGKESFGCAVPLRIGLAVLDASVAAVCPEGSTVQGNKCVRTNLVTQVECPAGTSWNGTGCAGKVDTTCASGMHFQAERGCVVDSMTPPPTEEEERESQMFEQAVSQYRQLIIAVDNVERQLKKSHQALVDTIAGMSAEARSRCHANKILRDFGNEPTELVEPKSLLASPRATRLELVGAQNRKVAGRLESLGPRLEQEGEALKGLQECKKANP